ncbi:transcriptional regulator [Roseibium hamelinense]|uniref:Transcriptional regulator n=1 Tax=Roseibium hamelinense TaxID=150831 RepID=A0A562T195_9HYPH|nr:LysR family transcriptional regulator [Roseibium hamelinense]MTI44425.1 LysR family transcriptional regulator [Roseibium hamelinense]TWI87391.1 transcriptional regulator [Roseibium hamelinense]
MAALESDLLRTFLAVAETRSVTDGALRIGRSQSATSMQIKRLEEVLGQPVFERTGRGVRLTDAGTRLVLVAQDVLARLDAAYRDITSDALGGKLRLGIPDDHGRARLAGIVAAFAQSHPKVELEVNCSLSIAFPSLLDQARLDLAVHEVAEPSSSEEVIFEDPTVWAGVAHVDLWTRDPVPVALFDQACWWREAAVRSLTQAGRRFQVVYSSQSVEGIKAAVAAGVAIGLLGRSSIDVPLKVLGPEAGLGPTPVSHLVMGTRAGQMSDAARAMKQAIRTAFQREDPAGV